MTSDQNALARIGAYCDAAPRPTSVQEDVGPFTLFLSTGAFPYYARPRLGTFDGFGPEEVAAVRARQIERGVPECFEWIDDLALGLDDVLAESGLEVAHRPLLVLDELVRVDPPDGVRLRFMDPEASLEEWTRAVAAVDLGFSTRGTNVGTTGPAELESLLAQAKPERMAYFRWLAEVGLMRWLVAEDASGPVGGGRYHPRQVDVDGEVRTVTEITGIATMASMRRRGIGAALVSTLVEDAYAHGIDDIFMGATDDPVARVYERVGFRRIGTNCEANPAQPLLTS